MAVNYNPPETWSLAQPTKNMVRPVPNCHPDQRPYLQEYPNEKPWIVQINRLTPYKVDNGSSQYKRFRVVDNRPTMKVGLLRVA